jgi:hypothetical protein
MRLILLILLSVRIAIALLLAEEATNFRSPDGRFALSGGSYETGHRDNATGNWIIDSKEKPAAIVDQASHKVLLQLESALRPEEDKVLWSADSKWLAFNHRGNKQTDLSVYFWNGESFELVKLPELPEPELKFKPYKKAGHPFGRELHFDEDTVTPLRWLKSGALVVSREYGMTDNTAVSTSYSRFYIITIGFDAKHIAFVQNITKQKQKVDTHN